MFLGKLMPLSRGSTWAAVAASIIASATLLAFQTMRTDQEAQLVRLVDAFAREITIKIDERLKSTLDVPKLVHHFIARSRGMGPEDLAELGDLLRENSRDVQALNWIGPDGVIQAVSPVEGNGAALGLRIWSRPVPAQALRASLATRSLRATPPIALAQGGRGFAAYLPVIVDEALLGFVNVVFRSDRLVDEVIHPDPIPSFHVSIHDGGIPIRVSSMSRAGLRFAKTNEIDVGGRTWSITVAPTASAIASSHSPLDELILAFGLLGALAVGLLLREAGRSRKALRDREERFDLAMQGASDGLFDWNAETGETYYSPRWFQMLGYEPGELPSEMETFLSLLHPDDLPAVRRNRAENGLAEGIAEEAFRMRRKDGAWADILSRAIVLRTRGKLKRVVGTHVDITELRRQQRELEVAATTDDLTGLKNRRGLPRALISMVQLMRPGERLTVMHLDLDMFKAINDTHGHDAGDHALVATARRLLEAPQRFDLVARVGGDEFLLARRTPASDEEVMALANELIARLSEPLHYEGHLCRLGASIGVAFLGPDDAGAIDGAVAQADIALNAAKSLGRGRCLFFREEMRRTAVEAAWIMTEIERALEQSEFEPFFQPQKDSRTGAVVGFEALARWRHPTRGWLTAAEFVPYAENNHLIAAIDDSIFRQSCDLLGRLPELGLPRATVSVNVSTAQLHDPGLVDRLRRIANEASVDPGLIRIEILESTLLTERGTNVVENILKLSMAGFLLDLDDFGTGHTAIASLLNFPISRIKIDRSLISNIHADPRRQTITGAILEMSGKLSVGVVAEGVETSADLEFLMSAGCGCVQGYHVGAPMPIDALQAWISKHSLLRQSRCVVAAAS